MRLLRFDSAVGFPADRSVNMVVSRIACPESWGQIACYHFAGNARYGLRQVILPQLFLVVTGEGWVRSEEAERIALEAGQAMFWEAGEWLEAGSETGMTVIVVEGEIPDPMQFMPAMEERQFGRKHLIAQ